MSTKPVCYSDREPTRRLLVALAASSMVIACGDSQVPDNRPAAGRAPAATADDETAAQYREKVKRRVSSSVVSSFSREWNVSESDVECVLADLSVTQLDDAASDAAVASVFEQCRVDPAVVK